MHLARPTINLQHRQFQQSAPDTLKVKSRTPNHRPNSHHQPFQNTQSRATTTNHTHDAYLPRHSTRLHQQTSRKRLMHLPRHQKRPEIRKPVREKGTRTPKAILSRNPRPSRFTNSNRTRRRQFKPPASRRPTTATLTTKQNTRQMQHKQNTKRITENLLHLHHGRQQPRPNSIIALRTNKHQTRNHQYKRHKSAILRHTTKEAQRSKPTIPTNRKNQALNSKKPSTTRRLQTPKAPNNKKSTRSPNPSQRLPQLSSQRQRPTLLHSTTTKLRKVNRPKIKGMRTTRILHKSIHPSRNPQPHPIE